MAISSGFAYKQKVPGSISSFRQGRHPPTLIFPEKGLEYLIPVLLFTIIIITSFLVDEKKKRNLQ